MEFNFWYPSLAFQSERELMKSIIPEQSQSTIFDKLIQAAMDIFISEGEVLNIDLQIAFFFNNLYQTMQAH